MIEIDDIGRSAGGARRFTMGFKLAFVREWNQCTARGDKVRMLRQYNLRSGTVGPWVEAERAGKYTAAMVTAAERSPRRMDNKDRAELARLRVENARLQAKVTQSEAVVEILGKAYELLEGITTSSPQDEEPQIPLALMSASEYAQWLERHNLS